jgi:hypothetical protein
LERCVRSKRNLEVTDLISFKKAGSVLAVGALLCAHSQPVYAGDSFGSTATESSLSAPGEQVDGSLIVPEQGADSDTCLRLSPEQVRQLEQAGSARPSAPIGDHHLPPIFVQVSCGYYDRVAYSVTSESPEYRHRRRSMASRGAHPLAPRKVTRTHYRLIYHRQSQRVDITPMIMKYADKYQLDPWLVRGVIEVESAFRPNATSRVGAGGLMQLMPGTASHLGCRNRFDPEQNIAAGSRYIRQMYDKFGSYTLAIAAYNAGPGNVQKHGGIPPFAETQNYVRKVTRAWQVGPGKS